jgi:hypothetical protein
MIACEPDNLARRFEQLRQLNEIQHRVSSYIGHALGRDENLDWISTIARYVFEPMDKELQKGTTHAWVETRKRFAAAP